jgi:WhiB family transcriptional regulator, redox-sensing transcriptional regulator
MIGGGSTLRKIMYRTDTSPQPADDFFAEAACTGVETSVFFPVSDTFAGEAKAICAECPVAERCLEYAIATHQSEGVWGGLTGTERHRLVRRRQKLAREQRERSSAA